MRDEHDGKLGDARLGDLSAHLAAMGPALARARGSHAIEGQLGPVIASADHI